VMPRKGKGVLGRKPLPTLRLSLRGGFVEADVAIQEIHS
jgi:hypothetical protein